MISISDESITKGDLLQLGHWLGTNPRLTQGPKVMEFEDKFAVEVGSGYAVYCNSGSSANLLTLWSLVECAGRLTWRRSCNSGSSRYWSTAT